MARPKDSLSNTIIVATLVCGVCSIFVSSAAVGLRERQERNKEIDRQKNILMAGGIFKPGDDDARIPELFERVKPRLVDLATGEYVATEAVDAAKFDQREAARDPETSVTIAPNDDVASIRRRSKLALVYLLESEGGGGVEQVILPIHGYGLWSTLYGFIALDHSGVNTIRGITFYEHGETPGLGGEVDNPSWKARWIGKKAFCADGTVCIEVLKGAVQPSDPEKAYHVDGLAGATLTSRGVSSLLQYWLGAQGFGPYIAKLKTR